MAARLRGKSTVHTFDIKDWRPAHVVQEAWLDNMVFHLADLEDPAGRLDPVASRVLQHATDFLLVDGKDKSLEARLYGRSVCRPRPAGRLAGWLAG